MYGSLDNGENTYGNGKSRKTLRQAVQKFLIHISQQTVLILQTFQHP